MEIWLTSDLHLNHNQSFIYEPRGFINIKDMNEAIIENWNSVVKPDDIIYNLGDTIMGDQTIGIELYKKLNGTSCMIWGNHCTENKQKLLSALPNVIVLGYAHVIKHGKFSLYLSHYPTLTANFSSGKHFSRNVINLHGHVHSRTPWINLLNPFMYDVGMDAHKCTPVHIDEVMFDIRQRWEEIGRLPTPVIPDDNYPYDKIFT